MKTVDDILNETGYPLQIHLEELIKDTYKRHFWHVLVNEHRWINGEKKDDGYIDFVLYRDQSKLRLVVECKRIKEGSWNFLLPTETEQIINELKFRALSIDRKTAKYSFNDLGIKPESLVSSFCVMETKGEKDTRTLEKLSGELLLSIEYLQIDETDLLNDLQKGADRYQYVYIPIIVTTAKLQTVKFIPSTVDIKSGNLTDSKKEPVEFIRFQKNLATHLNIEKTPEIYSLQELNQAYDRTIFVVQAESFIRFLTNLKLL